MCHFETSTVLKDNKNRYWMWLLCIHHPFKNPSDISIIFSYKISKYHSQSVSCGLEEHAICVLTHSTSLTHSYCITQGDLGVPGAPGEPGYPGIPGTQGLKVSIFSSFTLTASFFESDFLISDHYFKKSFL